MQNRFFRGLGASVRLLPTLTLSAFGSRRSLDARTASADGSAHVIESFATSGLHRTVLEAAQKDAAREDLLGSAVELNTGNVQVGLVGYRTTFSHAVQPPADLYRRFDFAGRSHTMVSSYASASTGNAFLFGEVARSAAAIWGGIGGLQVDVSAAEAVVAVRHYPHNFVSLHGRAFGEQGGPPQNESGLYLGLHIQPAEDWHVSGYFDQYRFPWLRYTIPRPTDGHEARFVIEHRPRSWLHYYLQLRTETREKGHKVRTGSGGVLEGVRAETHQSARLHGEFVFNTRLRLRSRLAFTRYDNGNTSQSGMLLYQGLRWRPKPWLRIDGRWTLFETDGFETRLYTYEHDLLYAFSVPMFNGRGERRYVLLNLEPLDRMHLELKYSITRYRDVTSVGSGLDEVQGPRVREVRAQVRWRF